MQPTEQPTLIPILIPEPEPTKTPVLAEKAKTDGSSSVSLVASMVFSGTAAVFYVSWRVYSWRKIVDERPEDDANLPVSLWQSSFRTNDDSQLAPVFGVFYRDREFRSLATKPVSK